MGVTDSFKQLIQQASDPLGAKAMMDRIFEDLNKIGQITQAEKSGKPIDLQEAERICSEVDDFILQGKNMPGIGNKLGMMSLGGIQRGMHKHLAELREKAKTQGVVSHEPDIPKHEVVAPMIPDIRTPTIQDQVTSPQPESVSDSHLKPPTQTEEIVKPETPAVVMSSQTGVQTNAPAVAQEDDVSKALKELMGISSGIVKKEEDDIK